MKRLNEIPNGNSLPNNDNCYRMDDVILTEHMEYVRTKNDVRKVCGACEVSSVCLALVSENTVDLYPKKAKPNTQEYEPVKKKKQIRGKKR